MDTINAYAAGIFDGEGYVDIYSATPPKASKSPSFLIRVIISQKDGRLINWLESNFKGHVYSARKEGKYPIYRWDSRAQNALNFLKAIQPFVVVKKDQVDLAIKFEERKQQYVFMPKGSQGFNKISPEEIKWRLEMKDNLKSLKKNYIPYTKNSAPTTTNREEVLK